MLVENQIVETKWSNANKEWLVEKGYSFTKMGVPLYVKAEDLSHGSNVKVDCKCDYCGKIKKITYQQYLQNTKDEKIKFACVSCRGKKLQEYRTDNSKQKYFDDFRQKCYERGYIPVSTIDDYINEHSKLKYLCPKHGVQEIDYSNFKQGKGCAKCSHEYLNQKNTLSIEKVIEIIESKNNNKLLNPEEYDKVKTNNLRIRCGKCGNEFTTSLSSILAGGGACRKCGLKNLGDLIRHDIDFIKDTIESKNGNILLNPEDYIDARTNNLLIKCGSCGKTFSVSLTNYQKNLTGKCPDCNNGSVGEYLIAQFLDQSNVKYIRQYRFDDCRDTNPLPFDFYLPDYNLCIEFDGKQHYQPWYNEDAFIKGLLHDAMKNNYCKWNNIDLLRIPYWERKNLKTILRDKLGLVA